MPYGSTTPVYAPDTEHIPPDTVAAIFWLKNRIGPRNGAMRGGLSGSANAKTFVAPLKSARLKLTVALSVLSMSVPPDTATTPSRSSCPTVLLEGGGIPTARGGKWFAASVRDVLARI